LHSLEVSQVVCVRPPSLILRHWAMRLLSQHLQWILHWWQTNGSNAHESFRYTQTLQVPCFKSPVWPDGVSNPVYHLGGARFTPLRPLSCHGRMKIAKFLSRKYEIHLINLQTKWTAICKLFFYRCSAWNFPGVPGTVSRHAGWKALV